MAAAATDKFKKTKDLFSTTLSSGINSTDLTIPLNSVSGLPTDTGVTLTIDAYDGSGTATPNAREVVTGIVSGSNIVLPSTAYRGREGSAQAHSAGAVVTQYWTKTDINDAMDGILVHSRQDGALKAGTMYDANDNEQLEFEATASALNNLKVKNAATGNNPQLLASGQTNKGIDFIDSNGNEIIKTVATASAVNEVTFTSAATGSGPTIESTGGDTNIGLTVKGKGTGTVTIGSSTSKSNAKNLLADGLRVASTSKTANYTMTALDFTALCDASGGAFSITLPTAASIAGTRYTIRKTDTSTNLLTLATTSSQTIDGVTTLTMLGLSTVTVESDGSNWFVVSAQAQWSSFTPTWSASSGSAPSLGNGTLSGRFRKINRRIEAQIRLTAGSTTTFGSGGQWRFTLPQNPSSTAYPVDETAKLFIGNANDTGASLVAAVGMWIGSSTNLLYIYFNTTTTGAIHATQPFTWANTDTLFLEGAYETAT